MNEKLTILLNEGFVEETLERIRSILLDLYGDISGERNFRFVNDALSEYLDKKSEAELKKEAKFDPDDPYAHLAGKIVAICYPDNIYDDEFPTLQTLERILQKHFPSIKGIHILPERMMSHGDLWPQDLHQFLEPDAACDLVRFLQEYGALDQNRFLNASYDAMRTGLEETELPGWFEENEARALRDLSSFTDGVIRLLDEAFNSHFNDGGFSQKTRKEVDPRFGTTEDIKRLSKKYAVMLDYVVNHLDFENPILDAFRIGENDGSAFIIITPDKYDELKRSGEIDKTFRPRPFPLFTGMRKKPRIAADVAGNTIEASTREMNVRFGKAGLDPLDKRLIDFLSIDYKVRNDQGLTASDKRVFERFQAYLAESGIEENSLFRDSGLQPLQKVYSGKSGRDVEGLLDVINVDLRYAEVFNKNDDEVFGEKFFIYTTFSESQVDVNPMSEAGFRLVIDDLFHLLGSGGLAMMRMDAIKYLWKGIGERNFDMEEGNKLIEAIRLIMRLAAPNALPLDEINSPDQVVYEMCRDGGFAYLFGQVNAVPIAFNEGSLKPIQRFCDTMKLACAPNLTLFVMLSTHDGRSVQGIGVQRSDGHVSIEELYRLKEVVEERGGKPKYRSVPKGEIASDTLKKVCEEAGLDENIVRNLFEMDSVEHKENLRLKKWPTTREDLLVALADETGKNRDDICEVPAVDYFLDWIIEGKTAYELCCTSRNSFLPVKSNGDPISPAEEAARLTLAQLYVLTLGQVVPAIYFNDLLGLGNDMKSFELTGKPRDLNRHKTHVSEIDLENPSDAFTADYITKINRILETRAADEAFYPGNPNFEFRALTDKVFINHPFAKGIHSFIVGNISDDEQIVDLDISDFDGVTADDLQKFSERGLIEKLSGSRIRLKDKSTVTIVLPAYGAVWLK